MPDDYRFTQTREPPHNFEAEQALLGAIMVNNRAYERVSEFLRPEHFADPVNGRIYEACGRLIDEGKTAGPVTLKGAFDGDDALTHVGGAAYLVKLAASVVTVINAADYGREIRECHLRRQLIELGEGIVNSAFDRGTDSAATSIIEGAESDLFTLVETDSAGGLAPVGSDVDDAMAHIDAAAKNGGKLLGLSTGLNALDTGTGGLLAPDLIILAARPSMGKTSLGRQIAYNVARTHGPVAFFSLEMSRKQQTLSILAALANLPVVDVLHGNVGDGWEALQRASSGLKQVLLHFDDRAGLKVPQIRAACRRMKRKHGLSAVVIDYLQLLQPEGRTESQNVAVTQISGGLKAMAKELGVPVLALSQLSRGVEARDDKRPILADLRDSGAIEQDADQVWFLYRAEYYLRKEEPQSSANSYMAKMADWRKKIDPVRGKAEVDIAKRRMGPVGRVDLRFLAQTTAFGEPF